MRELVALWGDIPDPPFSRERADRVFEGILWSLDRREKRRRRAWLAAFAIVPFFAAALGATWLGRSRWS